MRTAALTTLAAPDRAQAASLAAGAVAGCALLALVDPNEPGRYPACPTAALLGVDCPACGTLRGVHALVRGRPLTALDHNLLLLAAAPLAVVVWWHLAARAAGRPRAVPRWPAWASPAAVVIAALFGILRNLPVDPFRWLGAGA